MRKLFLFIFIVLSVHSFSQEKRLALVIGNSAYEQGGELRNPVNDARAMNQALTQVGFDVMEFFNLDEGELKQAIDEFGIRLKSYDVGLFFYAGHGIQASGENYLIPVDANLTSEPQVEYDCVEAARVLSHMDASRVDVKIMILDACRNNPFERSWTRSTTGRGLAFMNAPTGTLIAYATSPGRTASDGTGQNGLFTSAILNNITIAELSIEDVFKKVRIDVINQSNGQQTPWEATSLTGEFYFNNLNLDIQKENIKGSNTNAEASKTNHFSGTKGIFLDVQDKQEYRWIRIGDQIWMAENLKTTMYNDGRDISKITNNKQWKNLTTPAYCWYENQESNRETYGVMYNWLTVETKKLCPSGWHVPSKAEWYDLASYIQITDEVGGKLKESGTDHWIDPNTGATNETGFTALPGGYRKSNGKFDGIGRDGIWWTSTEYDAYFAVYIFLGNKESVFSTSIYGNKRSAGGSVRCVKDQP